MLQKVKRVFDASNPNWSISLEYNKIFLASLQNHFTDRLRTRGYLYLNEVLDFDRDFLEKTTNELNQHLLHEMGIEDSYYYRPSWLFRDTPEPQGVYITKTSIDLSEEEKKYMFMTVKPVKVIFNNPATIVIWDDGTKTVVKKQKGDRYDKEKGLALCYMKKALGNTSRQLNNALRKGLEE